jgi:formate C-acetyltransferase
MAQTAEIAADKNRLLRMAAACRRVPMQPPRDFYEALQSAWLLRVVCCASTTCGVSVSFGNFDRYMYPYYLISKQNGMTEDAALALLVQFFRMLDQYDGNDCALSVGGVDENGNDATNELSWLLLKAEKITRLRGPLFVARINKNTPKEFMRELVCKDLFEIGQPSFYSEENCLAAVKSRGIDETEAKRYQISSCMCLSLPHNEAVSAWGAVFNTHLPLETALCGEPLYGELPADMLPRSQQACGTMEELWARYAAHTATLLGWCLDRSDKLIAEHTKFTGNPWLSALTDDCIHRGKDRWDGGAVYHNAVIETFALADTADAFTAIQKLVFEEKKYTVAQFVQAARANYEGFEELHRDILACPKYGMGEPAADENAQRLARLYADLCEARYAENRRYLPSLHTLSSDISWGVQRPAFFGGRKAGEPIAKNAGPTTAARKAGPTNLVLSAGSLE